MTVADKILFTCTACSYKARIPAHYSGRSIHCPKCKTVQEVGAVSVADTGASEDAPDIAAPSTPAPGQGKIVFTCAACSYKGRLASEYDGKTIRCPGCQTPQIVKGEAVTSPIVASMAADENVFKTGESEKIRFECNACGYRAKIPSKYAGKPIHCPQCKEVQQVKAETDMEAATGRTVTIARVDPAKVREPKLAMTNVGISFECTVCGYASKISPSCAGDAVYCPSCRSPQKVEWGDPDEEEMLAEEPTPNAPQDDPDDAAAEPAPPVAPPSATALSLQLGVNNTPLATPVLPVAPPRAPVARVAPVAPPAAPVQAAPPEESEPEPEPEQPSAPAATPVAAAARGSAVQRPRRAVQNTSDADEALPASSQHAAPMAAKASKVPLLITGMLALVFLAVAVVLFLQVGDLKQTLADEQSALATQKQATATEATARQAAEGERDAATTRAEREQARADAAEQTVATLTTRVEALVAEGEAKDAHAATLQTTIDTLTTDLEAAQAASGAATDKNP